MPARAAEFEVDGDRVAARRTIVRCTGRIDVGRARASRGGRRRRNSIARRLPRDRRRRCDRRPHRCRWHRRRRFGGRRGRCRPIRIALLCARETEPAGFFAACRGDGPRHGGDLRRGGVARVVQHLGRRSLRRGRLGCCSFARQLRATTETKLVVVLVFFAAPGANDHRRLLCASGVAAVLGGAGGSTWTLTRSSPLAAARARGRDNLRVGACSCSSRVRTSRFSSRDRSV
jgi:hypothetical protein